MAADPPAELRPPFFAIEGHEVHSFESLEEMASDLEAIDTRNGVYELFDSRGRRLQVTTVEFQITAIEPVPASLDAPLLESRLRGFFARLPDYLAEYSEAAVAAKTLDDLVELRERLGRLDRASLRRLRRRFRRSRRS